MRASVATRIPLIAITAAFAGCTRQPPTLPKSTPATPKSDERWR